MRKLMASLFFMVSELRVNFHSYNRKLTLVYIIGGKIMFRKFVEILMDLSKALTCGELLRNGVPADSVVDEWKLIDAHNRREAEKLAEG